MSKDRVKMFTCTKTKRCSFVIKRYFVVVVRLVESTLFFSHRKMEIMESTKTKNKKKNPKNRDHSIDQKLPSSSVMISFNPSQISWSLAITVHLPCCCQAGT